MTPHCGTKQQRKYRLSNTATFVFVYCLLRVACYFAWVWNLFADIAEGKEAEGV